MAILSCALMGLWFELFLEDAMVSRMRLYLPCTFALLVTACGGEDMMMMNPGTATTAAQVLADCVGNFDVSDVDAPATFRVDGTRLVIRGVYMDATSNELIGLLDSNPAVRT